MPVNTYEMLWVSEDEMFDLRAGKHDLIGIPQYCCQNRLGMIVTFPRLDPQQVLLCCKAKENK